MTNILNEAQSIDTSKIFFVFNHEMIRTSKAGDAIMTRANNQSGSN